MEQDNDLHPDTDDLPLRANTNHILVKHYVLNLTVHIDRKVISGSVVLFLEPCPTGGINAEDNVQIVAPVQVGGCGSEHMLQDVHPIQESKRNFGKTASKENTMDEFQVSSGITLQSSPDWEDTSDEDFTLVLDCCDIYVVKVEEVDISSLSFMSDLQSDSTSETSAVSAANLNSAAFAENVISMPSSQWKRKHQLYLLSTHAPGVQDGSSLHFYRDQWSLQVRKMGISSPLEFPRALRICYETKPSGRSVRWTKDQDNRVCVYTAGSPINNRALFPCQEPPVALSTWQATIRAPFDCLVLMSGEEQTSPINDEDTRFLIWNYYVTMPMPASTFTLAVGHWQQVTAEIPPELGEGVGERADWGKTTKFRAGPTHWTEAELVSGLGCSTSKVVMGSPVQKSSGAPTICPAFTNSSLEDDTHAATDYSGMAHEGIFCSHGDYPCRFTQWSARSQRVIPHRVFGPVSLLQKAQALLKLLPRCLGAAYTVLGVHPFPRLDVLIVPAGFSSLGMASPHIIFLSQSVLNAGISGSEESDLSLCGSRICHEIAHSWFGLVIGAKDWTEEWISEGFATYLEDIIWAKVRQFSVEETKEDSDLKALLRWRRLSDELKNSEEELQILRPNMENTGQVTESGSSTVKHALNPDKAFMQVHYLKGYFLLRFLASQVGEQQFITFLRIFVKRYHGQLVLSQDFLRMLLITFPDMESKGLTLHAIYADWLDRPGIPKWLYERSAVWSQARLVKEVKAEAVKWILLSRSHGGKSRKRKRTDVKVNYKQVTSEQLVMLLELLLEEEELSKEAMEALHRAYNLQRQDAEMQGSAALFFTTSITGYTPKVRHRWCELVVKHTHTKAYRDVENFLVHDQAMGVYLYGELMVQEDPQQQALARHCLSLVQEEMDQSARRVVEEMVL